MPRPPHMAHEQRHKRHLKTARVVLGLLCFVALVLALRTASAQANETTSPSPNTDKGLHWLALVGMVVAALMIGIIVGILSWESYVSRWQRRQAAAREAAYARLPPQEKIRIMLRQIYDFIGQVDRQGFLVFTLWEKEKWEMVLTSQTLMVFARRSDTMRWTVDSHDDMGAIMSMRLSATANPNQILNKEFKEVMPDAGTPPVSDRDP